MADAYRPSDFHAEKAPFVELLRDGRAFPTVLVLLSAMSQALQVLVIAIIMPTVVAVFMARFARLSSPRDAVAPRLSPGSAE